MLANSATTNMLQKNASRLLRGQICIALIGLFLMYRRYLFQEWQIPIRRRSRYSYETTPQSQRDCCCRSSLRSCPGIHSHSLRLSMFPFLAIYLLSSRPGGPATSNSSPSAAPFHVLTSFSVLASLPSWWCWCRKSFVLLGNAM